MSDVIDEANDLAMNQNEDALAAIRSQVPKERNESELTPDDYICIQCGGPIFPEARVMKGLETCIDCQRDIEKYTKHSRKYNRYSDFDD